MASNERMNWGGVFAPITTKSSKSFVNGGVSPGVDFDKPRKVDKPPYEIPSAADLETWAGIAGYCIDTWIYDGVQFLTVIYNHTNVCFEGEDVPSNDKAYVYIYDENDLEDVLYSELGITPGEDG